MPNKPKNPCSHPGCPNLTDRKYCELHKKEHTSDRPSAESRGYDARWRKASKRFLLMFPFCSVCQREGKITKATVVDHIVPHRGDQNLFWDEQNWQPLCKSCHDKKTWREDRYREYRY